MKWSSLFTSLREKVGLGLSGGSEEASPQLPPQPQPQPQGLFQLSPWTSPLHPAFGGGAAEQSPLYSPASSPARHGLELEFKRFWEEFRFSISEKEKEMALNMAVDVFCRLVKQQPNMTRLLSKLVETHIFSFVVGRAFVTDIEKLRIYSKGRSLSVTDIISFFTEIKDGMSPGSNLLYAVEVLVTEAIDKQPLLDSGLLSCLIHILSALLSDEEDNQGQKKARAEKSVNNERGIQPSQGKRLEIEGSMVHIMKALASHPSAAASLIEDDSLQLLFHMVANGSSTVLAQFKDGLVPLHTMQLHRHAKQILGLLLVNDDGSSAKYIHRHNLIKVLVTAVKNFDPVKGDSAYTMGIVDLLLECVELSHRPDAGSIRLREDIHNAHGYQFLVQFALTLSSMQKIQALQSITPKVSSEEESQSDGLPSSNNLTQEKQVDATQSDLSPALLRLLDVLVNLAQTGPVGGKTMKPAYGKSTSFNRTRTSSDRLIDAIREKVNAKVKDLEAVQVLQDIFLKADNVKLQAEVLNRMFKIFSSHIDNYELCQQVRTVPLLILNMTSIPSSLQDIILKILEYAVTVVNCLPEQELLSLCCLLQQPITTSLKHTVLAFFVKLLSFDQQYTKLLREVGILEVLLDDLKQCQNLSASEQQSDISTVETQITLNNIGRNMNIENGIYSSQLNGSQSEKVHIFEDEGTISIAWDCLFFLLKRAEANQQWFRSSNGVSIILPLLVLDKHRPGVLRTLSCLIFEDTLQAHPEELGALIEILKSEMVTSLSGSQYKIPVDAKCDTLGALCRILGANSLAQRVFGEASGFSLLLTTLHEFQSSENMDIQGRMKVFTSVMRAVAAGVSNNAINRLRLHNVLSSSTVNDLLFESGLLCVECEKQVIQLLLELALETIFPSPDVLPVEGDVSERFEDVPSSFLSLSTGASKLETEWIHNPSAIIVLIRSLLRLSPKVQLDVLKLIKKLVHAGSFNQESLTSAGCVGLLLEMIYPFMEGSSPFLAHALQVVEVLGSFRLSSSELRVLVRYVFQLKVNKPGHLLIDTVERLVQKEGVRSDGASLAPFVEMDMNKLGQASIQVSLGDRTWPPAAGYSFVCWFQYRNLLKKQIKELEHMPSTGPVKRNASSGQVLHIFSVGAVNDGSSLYAEFCLQEDGVFTLATSNNSSLSFPAIDLEEERWHHLAIVHSKPNALAGLFQASVAYLYLNGKIVHTGKLGYSPSPVGKSLQVTIGTPASRIKKNEIKWRLRSCYLFEEVLTSGSICFMYILGRGYRGLFQDNDLLRFVPYQACGGGTMAILDSLEAEFMSTSSTHKLDSSNKQANSKPDGSGIVWDLEGLMNLSFQLSGKKLIFAFDGTPSETSQVSGTLTLLNLVDPLSSAASLIGGIPRYGRLSGDVYICNHCVIGDGIRTIGGMAVVLALVEAARSVNMLNMALELLACSLHQNSQNVKDMQILRGYHLLALFLHKKMSLFDMHSLDIFFRIAACEASFSALEKSLISRTVSFQAGGMSSEASLDDLTLPKFSDEISSVDSFGDLDDFSAQKDTFSHLSELENTEVSEENSNCIVLSNPDMVEHVMLDWTLWVKAPIPIQIALIGFLERMVSMHWYRNHNLTILRQINLVQHLLVTLQRGDVEVAVLEKLVVLLGVILEDGFLASELDLVIRFVIMTFDPPELTTRDQIFRETMGKHVIVRNMLLEMLIDLQVIIKSEELLEQWHKTVSSKLITFFLDEALHSTSMRWIMTLLGVCISSTPTFAPRFRSSGGYQELLRVLPSFFDSPEIYYVLFCLIFGKAVYPRVPEVRMLDFLALLPNDGNYGELKFVDLLETIIAMVKATFDYLSVQTMLAYQSGTISNFSGALVADLVEASADMAGELQGEALMHKTYAARLMAGEAGAPHAATSILRFMVDLAKTCPPFSALCRRAEFLETCVDLYFSCVRADCALKMAKDLRATASDYKNLIDLDDKVSAQNTNSSLPPENVQPTKGSRSIGNFPQEQKSASFQGLHRSQSYTLDAIVTGDDAVDLDSLIDKGNMHNPVTSDVSIVKHIASIGIQDSYQLLASVGTPSNRAPYSRSLSDKSITNAALTPITPVASSLVSTSSNSKFDSPDSRAKLTLTSSVRSFSPSEFDSSPDIKSNSLASSAMASILPISPNLLLKIDDSGYGGGPCSAGATAILDFIAEVLADIVSEQLKATQIVENILEAVPLYVDAETTLVFQGLCLSRLLNFLERRLLRDDEEDEGKLDNNRWSANLDSLCWMIVDRVYLGSFPEPLGVFRTLEFLISMLQLANNDGRIEEAVPAGKGILSITRGSKQLEAYIHAILKNTNRVIMYSFLPSYLKSIGEDDLLLRLSIQSESGKKLVSHVSHDEHAFDICTILQLLVSNKWLILCPSNLETDLICCLCENLIALLHDKRLAAQNLAVELIKFLLLHRQSALEDLLVVKPNEEQTFDVLHGGFDKLLTGDLSAFFEWFHTSEKTINQVLDQCSSIKWDQYVADSGKFPGERIKDMETRRKKEMGKKSKEAARMDSKHWDYTTDRRCSLESLRNLMSTALRSIRQDKYGWVLHAESEWQSQLQQLVHERGIFPVRQSSVELEWQLCPVEGPYRMRKKLERCKLKIDTVQNILSKGFQLEGALQLKEQQETGAHTTESDPASYFNILTDDSEKNIVDAGNYEESNKEGFKIESLQPTQWNDGHHAAEREASLHSAQDFGGRSSSFSFHMTDGMNTISDLGSPRQSPFMKVDDVKASSDKLEKELLDNGEYLIRPFLEPLEKIRIKYNCERVVGLDKHDGLFLIGELCLYVIENFYIDDSGCICEKESQDDLSVIDQALGVKKDVSESSEVQRVSTPLWSSTTKSSLVGGRAWAYNGGVLGKEKVAGSSNLPHPLHMWKLDSIHELLKRDYQLRPVAIEIFSMDGCNDLLVFHKKEREEVFKNLIAMNLPRNSMLDMTISGSSKQESNEGSRLFKILAKSFSKRWQNGEISNFQYLMHLNTLAGRGYSNLTQYPVFPWVLANYESENLDLKDPRTFRKLDKPMGCQTIEGEDEFRKRYESWDDPDVPKFHYGSHYSSAGIVLFYLVRLPPFSSENQKLQGGQFDHADRLFSCVKDTWLSAAGKGNTSDVKELIPAFFYMPEFLENRFNLDLGEKQSGDKVGNVVLPPWAKGSAREFIRKHREALESYYVSENLHHWIDLIFGYKQRGKAAEEAVNVFYHYTYEGNIDIDSVSDPTMKASILAQINHFGQTPKQLFLKPHPKRRTDRKLPPHPLRYCAHLVPQQIKRSSSPISQIVLFNEKILIAGANSLLRPKAHTNYISWGFPDRSLRILSYDQDRLLSTHENLHGGNQIQCAGASHDGQFLVTGADDGVVAVWRFSKDGVRMNQNLSLQRNLCAHTARITCLHVSQPYSLIVTGSEDCSVIIWDFTNLVFVKQLPLFPGPISAVYVNDLTGEILTAAGVLLAIWSINGDCLAVINTSQLPSDLVISVASMTHSDWQETNWYVTGHQSGAVKVWNLVHHSSMDDTNGNGMPTNGTGGLVLNGSPPEYKLVLQRILKHHKYPVTALNVTSDLRQLLSGDTNGTLISWSLSEDTMKASQV